MIDEVTNLMATLNRAAGELMLKHGATAATDVTGFGLLGHLLEICEASKVSAEVTFSKIPFLKGVQELASKGIVPGGTKRNLIHVSDRVCFDNALNQTDRIMTADAQTSGGLLIAIPEEKAEKFIRDFSKKTPYGAHRIGIFRKAEDIKRIFLY